MKISPFKQDSPYPSGGQPSAQTDSARPRQPCASLLWIGDTEHPAVAPAWRVCLRSCDAISIRQSIREALTAPPRLCPTHLIIAQTNRHERAGWAVDGPDLTELRESFADVKTLALRGPLVAPTVRLPLAASSPQHAATPPWVDSVSTAQAPAYLEHWLGEATAMNRHHGLRPVLIVASRYTFAESLIESLTLLFHAQGVDVPLVQWQRELTQRSAMGFATVLWDESVADPESTDVWQHRCDLAPNSRHVWITGLATPSHRASALAQGVYQVLDKPGRLECLAASLQTMKKCPAP